MLHIPRKTTSMQPVRAESGRVRVAAQPDPAGAVRCGEPMEPRLVRARDRFGQLVFATVWRCEKCGHIRR
jgi:hypothetical protein